MNGKDIQAKAADKFLNAAFAASLNSPQRAGRVLGVLSKAHLSLLKYAAGTYRALVVHPTDNPMFDWLRASTCVKCVRLLGRWVKVFFNFH